VGTAWVVIVAMGLSSGCALPTGSGAVSVSAPLEREAADMLLWSTRGKDLGLLARAYCINASPQERTWMRDTYLTVASPAKVHIICPKWSDD
jgi:hypothetical protein